MTDAHEAEYRERLQRALGPAFRLGDLIGRGGFGSVYAAVDVALDREVAVKALRHDVFPTPMVLERFEREAKALAKLRHAHILPIYAVGHGDGLAFMVMPLIRGPNLRRLLDGAEPVDPAFAIRVIVEIARALDAAHREGIVHRDVKPENILLEGEDRHALLSDFGIAKSTGVESELTGPGMALGSPQYMSPEQATADAELDARSDVYSLGTVAYEMLAGRRPYHSDSPQRSLVLQLTTEPAPFADLTPGVPSSIQSAVMRALKRDPSDRWPSAGDFAAALAPEGDEHRLPSSLQKSWLDQRGPVIFALAAVYFWTVGLALPLFDIANASGNVGMQMLIKVLKIPMIGVLLTLVYIAAEFGVTLARLLFGRTPRRMILDRLFRQPSWWLAWYPSRLRRPSDPWTRMGTSMRLMRTVLWLSTVITVVALPAMLASGLYDAGEAHITITGPVRGMITASISARLPLLLNFVGVAVGVVGLALTRRVPVHGVATLLVSRRLDAWNTPTGQRLGGS